MVEIYVSTDVETDGPVPGPHSMLSIGSAAYLADKTLVGTFSANLEMLPGASGHPDTMLWWETQGEAWAACRQNLQSPEQAMRDYVVWLKGLPGKPVFVGYPVVFDYMFVQWYLHKFTGGSPFSFDAIDVKTYVMAVLKKDYRDISKAVMPRHWFDGLPHTHLALDDAVEQGALFCNMLMEHTKENDEG
ncbi:MAG TPA: hypothetical protein VM095_18515 [Pyrinomonadaceae bacterium]|nr:hypothetical protein [Pyrinomonadaceae bacterium]